MAIGVNIEIRRAFVRLRRLLASHSRLEKKILAMEEKYDGQFAIVFEALKQLMAPPEPPPRKIGFEGKGTRKAHHETG